MSVQKFFQLPESQQVSFEETLEVLKPIIVVYSKDVLTRYKNYILEFTSDSHLTAFLDEFTDRLFTRAKLERLLLI